MQAVTEQGRKVVTLMAELESEKAKARENYKEKMKNATQIEVRIIQLHQKSVFLIRIRADPGFFADQDQD